MAKWANEQNRAVSKEKAQVANKHMKKYSISLAIKEMQIKAKLIFQLIYSLWKTKWRLLKKTKYRSAI
jgi:hypothetical protein